MAQAFQQIGCDVELVVYNSSLGEWLNRRKLLGLIWEQYGISTRFKINILPFSMLVNIEKRRDYGRLSLSWLMAYFAKWKKADVIYARDYLMPYWTAQMGIPTIAETHVEPTDFYQKQKLYEATKLYSFKALVSISGILADQFVEAGVPKRKITVEQDGVDFSAFSFFDNSEILRTKRDLLQQRKAIALYAGHLYDYKGIPLILQAAERFPDISFVLVGGWEEDIRRIKKAADDKGLKNIKLVGFIPNNSVSVYLKAADILLLPYSAEHHQAKTTSPLKLFEYMASGKPIIAAALDNIVTVLTHKRNAFLFNPDDIDSFSDAIKTALTNAAESEMVSKQACFDVKQYDYRERCSRILRFAGFDV
ncbi:MAG: glycosyltransferase [Deltaproteobacteria bacterium]|nr:glycosyltransferase [Deltaproteobacteria bacterium]